MKYSEITIEKHRCLVLGPPALPPGAPVVLTLHGLGTNADDLAPLCGELGFSKCRYVLPDAPLLLPGYPPGSFAWYDFMNHNREEIEASRDYLYKVLDHFCKDPSREKEAPPLIPLGFSQGGVMALEVGLNYKGKVAAIVSMSGYMPNPEATLAKPVAPRETPLLLVHGTQDPVVPVEGTRVAVEALKLAGYHPVFKEFPMPHTITEESLDEVREFLGRVILEK